MTQNVVMFHEVLSVHNHNFLLKKRIKLTNFFFELAKIGNAHTRKQVIALVQQIVIARV